MLSATVPSTNRKPGKATHIDLLSDEVAQLASMHVLSNNSGWCLTSLPVVLLRPPSLLYLTSFGYFYRLLVPFASFGCLVAYLYVIMYYPRVFWCLLGIRTAMSRPHRPHRRQIQVLGIIGKMCLVRCISLISIKKRNRLRLSCISDLHFVTLAAYSV